jgi:hypothetical protein
MVGMNGAAISDDDLRTEVAKIAEGVSTGRSTPWRKTTGLNTSWRNPGVRGLSSTISYVAS